MLERQSAQCLDFRRREKILRDPLVRNLGPNHLEVDADIALDHKRLHRKIPRIRQVEAQVARHQSPRERGLARLVGRLLGQPPEAIRFAYNEWAWSRSICSSSVSRETRFQRARSMPL